MPSYKAPAGFYRVVCLDYFTAKKTVLEDFPSVYKALRYCQEHLDTIPSDRLYIYDNSGNKITSFKGTERY